MTASVGPVSGTKLFITDPGTPVASPDPWVEIKDISNLGDISQNFAAITVSSIGDGDDYELKGQRTYPNFALQLNRNDSDPGQIALKAASAATRGSLYNFKIEETDGGTVVWKGEVFGYGPSYGGSGALRSVKTSVSIRPSTVVITLSA
jgi:hypothetical protein